MTGFLVELYISKTSRGAIAATTERLSRAASELRDTGRPVWLVRSICVPDDETCYLLVEASSTGDLDELSRRAELTFEHVAETTADIDHRRADIANDRSESNDSSG